MSPTPFACRGLAGLAAVAALGGCGWLRSEEATPLTSDIGAAIGDSLEGVPERIAIGDSVMLGAARSLIDRDFLVDAVESRQMIDYLPIVNRLAGAGWPSGAAVVHLGTNGPFSDDTADSFFSALAHADAVVVLTVHADRSWTATNNARVASLPERFPNVTVVDWDALVGECGSSCVYEDGIHLTPAGSEFYGDLIAQAVDRALTTKPGASTAASAPTR